MCQVVVELCPWTPHYVHPPGKRLHVIVAGLGIALGGCAVALALGLLPRVILQLAPALGVSDCCRISSIA